MCPGSMTQSISGGGNVVTFFVVLVSMLTTLYYVWFSLVCTHIVSERLSVMQDQAWAVKIVCLKFLECPTQVFEECGVQSIPPPQKCKFGQDLGLQVWVGPESPIPSPPSMNNWSGLGTSDLSWSRVPPPPMNIWPVFVTLDLSWSRGHPPSQNMVGMSVWKLTAVSPMATISFQNSTACTLICVGIIQNRNTYGILTIMNIPN